MSPTTLPIARLRDAGCRVSTLLGHDPLTSGKHPNGTGVWKYGITLPYDFTFKNGLDEALWSWNHDWSSTFGEAIAYVFQDGRVIVQAVAAYGYSDEEQLKSARQMVEKDVAIMLDRIATIIRLDT